MRQNWRHSSERAIAVSLEKRAAKGKIAGATVAGARQLESPGGQTKVTSKQKPHLDFPSANVHYLPLSTGEFLI